MVALIPQKDIVTAEERQIFEGLYFIIVIIIAIIILVMLLVCLLFFAVLLLLILKFSLYLQTDGLPVPTYINAVWFRQ
jgi:small-conductance mechanosensitive channel